ncbi:MAG: hypothetical protein KF762_17205 [Acidobacteria bacterium]|nr:hypothetical protein [Acidobacteriota bacterium]
MTNLHFDTERYQAIRVFSEPVVFDLVTDNLSPHLFKRERPFGHFGNCSLSRITTFTDPFSVSSAFAFDLILGHRSFGHD